VIAALYVETGGVYFGRPGIDPWDKTRDARAYAGPWPVVAHPPCERWGRYWHGGPSVRVRKTKGDDGGCFAAALAAVRKWGGVLEHPEASAAWSRFDLNVPPKAGAWIVADFGGGWTCCVEQGHYGHRARKATWLYACRLPVLPSLKWGPSAKRVRLDHGFHSAAERRAFTRPPKGTRGAERDARRAWLERHSLETGKEWCCPERMGKRERAATPLPFAELLIGMAGTAERAAA
jgi:hypothetical protein